MIFCDCRPKNRSSLLLQQNDMFPNSLWETTSISSVSPKRRKGTLQSYHTQFKVLLCNYNFRIQIIGAGVSLFKILLLINGY